MRKSVVLGLVVLMSSMAYATVGLHVQGGAGFVFKPGGAAQWLAGASPYFVDMYDQPSYSSLVRETEGTWSGTWYGNNDLADYYGRGISKAKADFGTLGVYALAEVSNKDAGRNTNNYYDWQASASASAEFWDILTINASGIAAGTPGTMTVKMVLDGDRTEPREHYLSGLSWFFRNYKTGSGYGINAIAHAGTYEFVIPIIYGVANQLQVGLVAEVGGFNQWGGGTSYVDFFHTATIGSMTFQNGDQQITDFTMTTGSGHNYIPEPLTLSLLALGGVLMAKRRK